MAEFEGLYVTIGGNTVEFENSISGVNKALGNLKKDMQNLNKELKLDPDNVDLLNSKLTNLGEQSHLAGLKILELKSQQDALGQSEVGSAEWSRLQTEINKVQIEMTSLDRAMEQTSSHIEEVGNPESVYNLNKALQETQQDLDIVNKKLQLDPNNVELAEQKMQLLQKAADLADQKVEALKKEQADLGEANIGTPEWRDLEEKIVDAQTEARGFEDQLSNTGSTGSTSMESIDKSLKMQNLIKFGDKVGELGNKLKDFGGAAIDAFRDYDDVMDSFITKTGDGTDELEKFYSSTRSTMVVDNAQDIADAYGGVTKVLGLAGDDATTAATQFLKFSNITGQDVSTSVSKTNDILKTFNMTSQESHAVLDIVTAVSQDTGISIDELTSGLVSGSEEFKALGLNVNESATFLGHMSQEGMDTGTSINLLSKATGAYAKDGLSLKDGLNQTAEALAQTTDQQDRLNIVADVFGTKQAPMLLDAIDRGAISFTNFGGSGTDALDRVTNTYESTLDPIDQYDIAQQGIHDGMAELGGEIQQVLAPALEGLSNFISKVVDWFKNLDPNVKTFVITVGILIVGLMLLAPVILMIAAAVMGLNLSMLPTIAVILGVIVIIGLIVVAIQNWGAIVDWIKEKWQQLTGWISDGWNKVKSFFGGGKDEVVSKTEETWNKVDETTKAGAAKLSTNVNNGMNEANKAVINGGSGIQNSATNTMGGLNNIFTQGGLKLPDGFNTGLQGIQTGIDTTSTNANASADNMFMNLDSKFTQGGLKLPDGFNTGLQGIQTGIDNASTNANASADNMFMNLDSKFIQGGLNLPDGFSTGLQGIQTGIDNTSINANTSTDSMFSNLMSKFTAGGDNLAGVTTGVMDKVDTSFLSGSTDVQTTTADMMTNLQSQFNQNSGNMTNLSTSAWNGVNNQFNSGTSDAQQKTQAMNMQLQSNFSNMNTQMAQQSAAAWNVVVANFHNGVQSMLQSVSAIAPQIASYFSGVGSSINGAIGNLSYIGSAITSSIISGLSGLGAALSSAVTAAIASLPTINDIIARITGTNSINLDPDSDGYGGAVSQLFNVKGFNVPSLEGFAGNSRTTTLNISVTANTSNGLDIAKAIERRLVRSLNGR